MADIAVDPNSPIPPFEQVRTQLAQRIHSGQLAAGSKLPTVRALAADLGLAVNTVARAYRELEDDGILRTRGRRGTFVRSALLDQPGEIGGDIARAAQEYAAAARRAGLSAPEALRMVEQAWGAA